MNTAEFIGVLIIGAFILGGILSWVGLRALGLGLIAMSSSSILLVHYLSIETVDFYRSKGLEAEANGLLESASRFGIVAMIAWIVLGFALLGLATTSSSK